MLKMKTIEWFFDFVSPYSYFQCEMMPHLPGDVQVEYRPVLFGGLLNHWGHKGPAEIPEKRRFTYRSLQWLSTKYGIPFKFPRAHPFNPLPLLRLSIAIDNRPDAVRDIFRFVYRDGKLPDDPEQWSRLTKMLNVVDADELVQSPRVKQTLREGTDYAISKGVFGVPTFVVDGEIFWGADFFDFLVEYLEDPALLQDSEMRRVSELPVASSRG